MILIVDDDAAVRSSLSFLLKHAGYESEAVSRPEEALAAVRRKTPALVLMDMNFTLTTSGEEGIRLLKQVKVLRPELPIILITAWGTISLAVQGMQAGAFDFVTKPWNNLMLLNSIRTALELSKQGKEEKTPLNRREADDKFHFDKIIGKSDALMRILGTVSRVAATNASILITGESGTGKELIAEAIHLNSPRAREPFVKVNLGGLSQSLFESEMFGHKKGAFTDACIDRIGRFEMADKGTIFLDEIGDLELSCQVKLLRVLQDQTFEALGDSRPRKIDVRVVSATNCDLQKMVAARSFREDLFYRINLISVHLPPLRERREDIPLLVRYFIDKQSEANGLPKADFTPAAYDYLCRLPYPGNIRELKNLVERTLLVSGKETIDVADLTEQAGEAPAGKEAASFEGFTLDELEKQSILRALDKHAGNLSRVASTLGVSRAALYRRLDKYGIQTDKH
ncbi:MAG: sigma-54 dependent transcriptional regulator [Tannerellaceae bacterium]|jgi:two-component system NtrC family response regulator|nr:sigma-54 dependent transcriptional regulator [Tannerellaceae bacterium]